MDIATPITVALGCLTVAGSICYGIFKVGKWHGEVVAGLAALGQRMNAQDAKIDGVSDSVSRVHERVDELFSRTPSPRRL